MTETAVAVAEEAPAAEPVPSLWPLAEEILAAHPRLHLALSDSPDEIIILSPGIEVTDLPLTHLIADPVIIEDPAAFDASLATIATKIGEHRAEVVTDSGAALIRATENLWPAAAPHFRPADDEAWAFESQQASVTDLGRWSRGKALEDDPETDKAVTRYLDAFPEDPEGDEDRAPLPAAEIHHETGEDR